MTLPDQRPKVIIIGGGLAGVATAVALAECGLRIELLEAKQSLGGRAGSYRDAESGERLDHCQHVAMGCCTNFLDLLARTGCSELLERHRRLHFFSAEGERTDFSAARWLPAPLHLLPALGRMKQLGWRDKMSIARAMHRLMRLSPASRELSTSAGEWLSSQRQTPIAIERFWQVVLVSALAESLDRVSLRAARKVFVDGFLAHCSAADVLIPKVSLGALYDDRIGRWLQARGVQLRLGTPVKQLCLNERTSKMDVQTAEEMTSADCAVVAVPWKHLPDLLDGSLAAAIPDFVALKNFGSSPIASVHLWTDLPITHLPHAVLIDRLSQWVFARRDLGSQHAHYYQVVISASRELAGRAKQRVIDEVWNDLQAVFPAARSATLQYAKLITQRDAVFTLPLELKDMRPAQRTKLPALVLAGDWTDTGWPATMEGAVRSGYLAAEQVLKNLQWPNREQRFLRPDLPRGLLVRLLIR